MPFHFDDISLSQSRASTTIPLSTASASLPVFCTILADAAIYEGALALPAQLAATNSPSTSLHTGSAFGRHYYCRISGRFTEYSRLLAQIRRGRTEHEYRTLSVNLSY
jgi:hypothetical protein